MYSYQDEISDVMLQKTLYDEQDFPELNFKNYKIIHRIWKLHDDSQTVIKHPFLKENLTVKNFRTLCPPNWLNDEVSKISLFLVTY